MSWRRVAVIYVVLAALAGYVFLLDRGAVSTAEAPVPETAGPSLLEADAAAVTTVTFHKAGRIVRATREDGRWHATEPAGAHVSPDLIAATIATLTAGQGAEKLAPEPEHDLAAYGLDTPSATVEVVIGPPSTPPVTVMLGARNPTSTAVYARRSDQGTIFLVGMNLSYYIDLIFDAAAA
jgi:hypothetical protein